MPKAIAVIAAMLVAIISLGCEVEDQKQTVVGGPPDPGVGGAFHQEIAQTVMPAVEGILTEVHLKVACANNAPMTLEIQSAPFGVPYDFVLRSQNFTPPATVDPNGPFTNVVLANPQRFGKGQEFAIVLSSTGSCVVLDGPNGDSYTGGNIYFLNDNTAGVWVCACLVDPIQPFDIVFETVMGTIPEGQAASTSQPLPPPTVTCSPTESNAFCTPQPGPASLVPRSR